MADGAANAALDEALGAAAGASGRVINILQHPTAPGFYRRLRVFFDGGRRGSQRGVEACGVLATQEVVKDKDGVARAAVGAGVGGDDITVGAESEREEGNRAER